MSRRCRRRRKINKATTEGTKNKKKREKGGNTQYIIHRLLFRSFVRSRSLLVALYCVCILYVMEKVYNSTENPGRYPTFVPEFEADRYRPERLGADRHGRLEITKRNCTLASVRASKEEWPITCQFTLDVKRRSYFIYNQLYKMPIYYT